MEEKNDNSGGEREKETIDLQAVAAPTRKRLGEAVEAAFLAKATMLGFPVLKPWGDSRPYDFAVESGRRLWRVQVKCATSHRGTRCEARAAGSGEIYTLDDIDFLAAYVIARDLWYVVPAEAFVPRVTVHFNYGPHSRGMFEIYRETWCLLTCSAKARARGGVPTPKSVGRSRRHLGLHRRRQHKHADKFASLMDSQFRSLARQPHMGRSRPELATNLRSFLVGHYFIFYMQLPKGAEIVRVLHGARDIESVLQEEE